MHNSVERERESVMEWCRIIGCEVGHTERGGGNLKMRRRGTPEGQKNGENEKGEGPRGHLPPESTIQRRRGGGRPEEERGGKEKRW
jgi:hypothetical protein